MMWESSRKSEFHGVLQDSGFYSGEMRRNCKVLGFPVHFKPLAPKALHYGLASAHLFSLITHPSPAPYSVTTTWPHLKSHYPLLQNPPHVQFLLQLSHNFHIVNFQFKIFTCWGFLYPPRVSSAITDKLAANDLLLRKYHREN